MKNFITILLVIIGFVTSKDLLSQCAISGDFEVCVSSFSNYEVTTNVTGGTITYLWYADGGGTISTDPLKPNITAFWNELGSWNLHCEIFLDDVLTEACLVTVEVEDISGNIVFFEEGHPLPQGELRDEYYYCLGDEIILTVGDNQDPVDYVWELHGVHVGSLVTSQGIEITFLEPGEVDVCAEITNEAGCQINQCLSFEVFDLNSGLSFIPFPNNVVNGTLSICKGQEYCFKNSSPDILFYGYLWTVESGTETWYYRTKDLLFNFTESASYTISLTRDLHTGCPIEPYSIEVVVSDKIITPILCPKPVCNGDEVCYTAEVECAQYQWSVSDEGTISGSTTDQEVCVVWHNNTGNTKGALSLIVSSCNNDNCTNPTTVYIPLFPPNLPVTGDEMVCGNDDHYYYAPYWPGMTYDWSYEIVPPSSGSINLLENGSTATLEFLDDFSGNIILTVNATQNAGECVYTQTKEISVYNQRIEELEDQCFGTDILVELNPPSSDLVDWYVMDRYFNTVFQSLMGGSLLIIPSSANLIPGKYTVMAMMPGGFPGSCMIQRDFLIKGPVQPPIITGATQVCLNSMETYICGLSGDFEWVVTGGTINK